MSRDVRWLVVVALCAWVAMMGAAVAAARAELAQERGEPGWQVVRVPPPGGGR